MSGKILKRFQPVFAGLIAHRLKSRVKRSEIAKELTKHGFQEGPMKTRISKYFSEDAIQELIARGKTREQAIDILLWRYREEVKNPEFWRRMGKNTWDTLGTDKQKETLEKAKKGVQRVWDSKSKKEKIDIATRRNRKRIAEGTSIAQIAKRLGHDERSKLATERWGKYTLEQQERIKRHLEKYTLRNQSPEKRREVAVANNAERSKRDIGIQQILARKSPEERSAIGTRGYAKRREKGTTFEQLREKMTPEEKSTIYEKIWETRRRNIKTRLAEAQAEERKFIELYFTHFFQEGAKSKKTNLSIYPIETFCNRPDYEDLKQECRIAILNAFREWDKTTNLNDFVNERVVDHMIAYFKTVKQHKRTVDISKIEI